jgi:tyrosyl-tRNA synthetase
MNRGERYSLITRNAAEVITKPRLKKLLEEEGLKGYIGVEPSGLFHVGWMIWASKLKDMADAGVEMRFFEATWHAQINDKLGGSLENIKKCARYLEHCLNALGVDVKRLEIVDAEELISDKDYWAMVLKVSKRLTLARVKRAMTIMGRSNRDAATDFSKLIYPAMQVSDIFYQDLDVCLGGMDQRRAHVLAIEVAERVKMKKPVAVHTPLLSGLSGTGRMETKISDDELADVKMSKSKPETCIFIHDTPEEVERKIMNAYCPPRQVEANPVMDMVKYILLSREGAAFKIERPTKYGGALEFESLDPLLDMYEKGELHPLDLKKATSQALNSRLEKVRRYFDANTEARRLYEELKRLTVTR